MLLTDACDIPLVGNFYQPVVDEGGGFGKKNQMMQGKKTENAD
ncbi:hypothetical protein [Anoxynatronum buryatiense]|nr:hypothetical protein [Anoxynatronum buryatiense]